MWKILKTGGIDPAPERSDVTWSQFLHSQAAVACDFFTIDTALLRRYYVLFFIHIPSRQVFFAGWIGTIRRKLLDRTIIWNQQQLERLIVDYIDHHNTHRPHRSLDQQPPEPAEAPPPVPGVTFGF